MTAMKLVAWPRSLRCFGGHVDADIERDIVPIDL